MNTIEYVKKHKIIAIARGLSKKEIIPTARALYDGGIRLLEVTYNQKNPDCIKETPNMIERLCDEFGDKMRIGAGTVMNVEQTEAAISAGAKYIISPNTNKKVIERALQLNAVSMPGALTPSEIVNAYEMGGQMIKIFPAGNIGLPYIKSLIGPLSHIPLLAVGGINVDNLMDFLNIGLMGAGIGSSLVNLNLIKNNDYDKLKTLANIFASQISQIQQI